MKGRFSEILAFTDFHGKEDAYRSAKKTIENEQPNFVIVAGDIINYDSNRAKQLLLDLASVGRPLYFVPGNMDGRELADWAGTGNVRGLHGRCEKTEGVSLIGLGGSPHGSFKTVFEYSEEEASSLLETAAKNLGGGLLIIVSHCPPKDTMVDRVSNGEHVGSLSVRRFVEMVQPALVVSGHIHESQGTDTIGSTMIVNTGPAQRGQYAEITINCEISVKFQRSM
jgi:Icc-related predicted phosphoesterase